MSSLAAYSVVIFILPRPRCACPLDEYVFDTVYVCARLVVCERACGLAFIRGSVFVRYDIRYLCR